ncbi:MAG: hypothetical protein ABI875_07715 [Gemmatimonadales bacterium]
MSDPRNVAHAKKVTQEKKHQGAKKKRGPAGAVTPPETPPAGASAAASESPTPAPPAGLEGSMTVLAKLKEMEFYSRANLEQLAALGLTVEDELKQQDVKGPLDEVYSAQNAFQTKLTTLIEAYKAECDRLQGESA